MWKRRDSSWARRRQGGLRVVIPLLIAFSLLLPLTPVMHASGGSAAPVPSKLSAPPAQRQTQEDIFLPEEGFGEPLYQSVLDGWLSRGFKPAPPEFEVEVSGAAFVESSGPRHVQVGDASSPNFPERYADLWKQNQALTANDPVSYPLNQNIRNLNILYQRDDLAQKYSRLGNRSGPVAMWLDDLGYMEWEVEVPQTALYNISIEYYPILGKRSSIQREIRINGELPFREARRIVQRRVWVEKRNFDNPECAKYGGVCRDNQGNDIRPTQREQARWESAIFEDADGRYRHPFMFKLVQGKNRLRLTVVRETMAIDKLIIHGPRPNPSYETYLAQARAAGFREVPTSVKVERGRGKMLFQAEDADHKSSPTIRAESWEDAFSVPQSYGATRYNCLGGWRWRLPGEWIEWEIEVPEDGLYAITMKVWQGWRSNIPRYRSLKIDGKTPFREVEDIPYQPDRHWQLYEVGKHESGERYLFAISKGKHVLRMEVTVGALSETLRTLDVLVTEMSNLNREMLMITGINPDPNMEWDLHLKIPDLRDRLRSIYDRLERQAEVVDEAAGGASMSSGAFRIVMEQIDGMLKRPHDIHKRIDEFARNQNLLSTWLLNLQNHPLYLDWIAVHPPAAATMHDMTILNRIKMWLGQIPPDIIGPARGNAIEEAWAAFNAFLLTFRKDFTGVGSIYDSAIADAFKDPQAVPPAFADRPEAWKTVRKELMEDPAPLEVWVGRGIEWGMIMKEMAETEFTPRTGIRVNVHIIPAGQLGASQGSLLILAQTAGEAPDVGVGVTADVPVEFAIRNGLVDLNTLPGYDEVKSWFRPGGLIPFRYCDKDGRCGDYALPETQDFSMLFYRKDILQELDMRPPETWDEVYEILPRLQQRGMDFFYPPPTFGGGTAAVRTAVQGAVGIVPFLYQNGGEFYTCSKNNPDDCTSDDILTRSSLDTPTSLIGFQEWTELYTNFKLSREANFFTRFRTGEMPVGVASYYYYVSFSVAAPELTGRWEMQPMPGKLQADGTIDRTSGGIGEAVTIFKLSERPMAAWEFVRWWLSAPTQQQYGFELEALIGAEARWPTANVVALQSLPWPRRDIQSVLKQWEWFKEVPVVLGGYFSARHILNAWNRVVLQGWNIREALEEATYEINKELARKQEEFGFDVDKRLYSRGGFLRYRPTATPGTS